MTHDDVATSTGHRCGRRARPPRPWSVAPLMGALLVGVLATGAAAVPGAGRTEGVPDARGVAARPHLVSPARPAAAVEGEDTAGSEGSGDAQGEAASSGTVTWALQPANSDGPDGRVSLRHEVAAGGSVVDAVALTNYSEAPASFELYAGAGTVTGGGDFDIVRPERGATTDASWVTVGPLDGATSVPGGLRLELPASSTVVVPISVRVPANATPGDHPVGVVAELVSGDDAVRLAARVGVRLHLRVTGDVVPRVAPTQVRAIWEPSWNPFAPGTVRLEYELANEGNVRLGAGADVTVSGPFGLGATTGPGAQLREVLPGQSLPATAQVEAWPLVRSTATVTVAPSVVGEDDVDAALLPATVTVGVWTVPWSQMALILLLVGGVLLVRRLRRRAAARTQARIDAAVAAATAELTQRAAGEEPEPAAARADESAAEDEAGGDEAGEDEAGEFDPAGKGDDAAESTLVPPTGGHAPATQDADEVPATAPGV